MLSPALDSPAGGGAEPAEQQLLSKAGLPAPILAVLEAVQFRGGCSERLRKLTPRHWESLLPWCDGCQITLQLADLCPHALPAPVRAAIADKYADYDQRMRLLKDELAAIARTLTASSVPFAVLKGLTHSPDLCPDPVLRAQGDIDLWCPSEAAHRAYDALYQVRYRPTVGGRSDRHLPPMSVPRTWRWAGKVSEVPISVEIHHQLWSEAGEGIPIHGIEQMWWRREERFIDGRPYAVLSLPDLVGFAAVHFFLHLVHGDLPLQRLWEIGNFLHSHCADAELWQRFEALHSPAMKQIEAIVFALAAGWFNCDRPSWALEQEAKLADNVKLWLRDFLFAPLLAVTDSNKNYLWLRLSLIPRRSMRAKVLLSTIVPPRLPMYVDSDCRGWTSGLIGLLRNRKWILLRLKRHVLAVPPTLAGGARWAFARADFKPGLGTFLVADVLFDTGEFLFVIIYSLYLLSLGLREDMIGLVASAMTAGNLIGSPLAAALQTRVGLRGLLAVGAVGGGAAGLFRALPLSHPMLLVTAALNGIFSSFWGVAYAPAIAGVTSARNRSTAFTFFTAMAMSIGIVAGLAAVRLPAWLSAGAALTPLNGKRFALCVSCLIIASAAIPAARLRLPQAASSGHRIYPRGPFIYMFVSALFLYVFATSSFNSFGIAYLSLRLHLPESRIGSAFSVGQALQVAAMLAGPLLIRGLGERRYVFLTAFATAVLLLCLAAGPAWMSLGCYFAYVSFQYMGEPSLFALLMNGVSDSERSGASTIMLLTMSVAATIAAAFAGRLITRLGYPLTLGFAATVAALAAFSFLAVPRLALGLQNRDNRLGIDAYDLNR